MAGRRVVITGMGWVTPLGCGLDDAWRAMLEGRGAARAIRRFEAGTFATNFAAEVEGFDLFDFMGERAHGHERAGLSTRFALAAAWTAWQRSGLGSGGVVPERAGVYLGAGESSPDSAAFGRMCIGSWDASAGGLDVARWARASAELDLWREVEQEPQMALLHVASALGVCGPTMNCMTACAASTQAIGEASMLIAHGDADVMVAGGSHSMIHPLGMTGFIRLSAMSTRGDDPSRASRPFDRTRDGFVMGEGAGVLVLEALDHALDRGAKPLAELAGYGSSADAYRITDIDPQGEGAYRAMAMALDRAGIDPRGVGADGRPLVHCISAHGTGTRENDGIETKAVRRLFGELAERVPMSSLKSMTGHLIQAAGAVELIACVRSLETGWLTPTINYSEADPACDLDYVANVARDCTGVGGVGVCLSNSFGFGGQNDSVVVRRWEG